MSWSDDNADRLAALVRAVHYLDYLTSIDALVAHRDQAFQDVLTIGREIHKRDPELARAPHAAGPVFRPEAPTVPDGRSALPPFVAPKPPPSRGRR